MEPPAAVARAVRFQDADPREIVLGGTPLDGYLKESGLRWVVRLRELLRACDVSELEQAYEPGGKPPFHPYVMLGLIVYGITLGMTSLRQLEMLARRDVGAWWLTGGLQPDHSTLGRFLVRHAETIQQGLFEKVTRLVLRRVALPTQDVAGDGTVIEAAASRFQLLTAEAAADYAARAPESERAHAQEVARVAQARTDKRAAKGKKGSALVARSEPDAVTQKQKDGRFRPSYKPSILANEHRYILAQSFHPSSETAVLGPLVEQATRTLEAPLPTLSLDAGYFCLTVLMFCLQNDIDILCPPGRLDADGTPNRKRPNGLFDKTDFRYDKSRDAYLCPAKRPLTRKYAETDSGGRRLHVYQARTNDCRTCALRAQCTTAKKGRKVKRYEGEPLLEAERQVMQHPSAQRRYRKRQASVEPVFAVLRRRGLTRFRRRGRAGAATEFALHCIAYNLERAAQAHLVILALCARAPGHPWRPLAVWAAIVG